MNPIQSAVLENGTLTITFTDQSFYRISQLPAYSGVRTVREYGTDIPGTVGRVDLTVFWDSNTILAHSHNEGHTYDFRISRSGVDNTNSAPNVTWRRQSEILRNNMRVVPEDGALIKEFKARAKHKPKLPEWF